jgi:transglutaminase-like putative cysteine protease
LLARLACLVVLALGLSIPEAIAATPVDEAPAPAWVTDIAIPKPRAARLRQVEDGIYFLLLDSQIKAGAGNEVFFSRNAYKVTDRSGLEDGARFDVDFDPSQEHVVLHYVRVIRNGVVIDHLADADIRVLHREQGLDKGVFDGNKTVHVEIKGVEVGDIVDYAYSWVSTATFWPNQFFGHVTTQWSVPLAAMRYRLVWPAKNPPLTIRNRATTLKPTLTHLGSDVVYTWLAADPDPVPSEDGTPAWHMTWGTVTLSSMSSWSDVVNWALPLYTGRDRLSPALARRADAIAAKFPKPEDRITAAMRLVEDEVRYVSMSIGAGSYTPRTPEEVVRSGFGDCKDKSQLLVALLRHLHIEAYVALTDIDAGPGLIEQAPAPTVFDHAIVQVRLNGKSYWLDPTGSNEGGRFPKLAALDYGWALPLAPGQGRLEKMAPPENAATPTYRTVERYSFGAGEHPDLALNVETVYRDAEADAMRAQIASKSAAQLERDYLGFYEGMYPGLTRAQPIAIADDRNANRITVREAYTLDADALRRSKLLEKFEVKASGMSTFDKIPSGPRTTPYKLAWPVNREQVIIVQTPGRAPPSPKPISLRGDAFAYSMDVARDGDTLTLDYRLKGSKSLLAAKEVSNAGDLSDKISDDNYWYLDLTSTAGGFIADKDAKSAFGRIVDILAGIGVVALTMWGYQGFNWLRRNRRRTADTGVTALG